MKSRFLMSNGSFLYVFSVVFLCLCYLENRCMQYGPNNERLSNLYDEIRREQSGRHDKLAKLKKCFPSVKYKNKNVERVCNNKPFPIKQPGGKCNEYKRK